MFVRQIDNTTLQLVLDTLKRGKLRGKQLCSAVRFVGSLVNSIILT